MFDLPDAKRVRRDELLSRDSTSRSPSPQSDSSFQDAHQRLGELLNLDALIAPAESTAPATKSQEDGQQQEDEEQEFEFRLFSAPAAPKSATKGEKTAATEGGEKAVSGGAQKLRIRLRSPTPGAVDGEGRFLNPFRGWQYYFTTPELLTGSGAKQDSASTIRKKQFEEVAVTGQQMLEWSEVPWPGCHLPWRVTHLNRQHTKLPPVSEDPTAVATIYVTNPPTKVPMSRKKPGKKRRIQLRKRIKAAEEAKHNEAEKRNRKNRERKIKRRQKARELKAAAAAASGQKQDSAEVETKDASDVSD
ncbi:DUF2011 domain-containing protein [Aspergillus thermomutatus]|uniref:Uncharacterized protein n=1 Tax=Aspergillus thermomutatus TaxID=41047 RepID=A0A397GZA5_ASPTH|nr:uncharacterized protein CDV56_106608 [Aspergillus thermomutatus]RHZ54383.1 hypothetical protein CDV56_106608 [Aspergillus thermomutatus]